MNYMGIKQLHDLMLEYQEKGLLIKPEYKLGRLDTIGWSLSRR